MNAQYFHPLHTQIEHNANTYTHPINTYTRNAFFHLNLFQLQHIFYFEYDRIIFERIERENGPKESKKLINKEKVVQLNDVSETYQTVCVAVEPMESMC